MVHDKGADYYRYYYPSVFDASGSHRTSSPDANALLKEVSRAATRRAEILNPVMINTYVEKNL